MNKVMIIFIILLLGGCTVYSVNVTVNQLGFDYGEASKVVVDLHDNRGSDKLNK